MTTPWNPQPAAPYSVVPGQVPPSTHPSQMSGPAYPHPYGRPGSTGPHAMPAGGPIGLPGAGSAPARRPLSFDDTRLTHLFQREPERCASLSEYAEVTGIDVPRLLDLLTPALDSGALALESAGGEVFVHTAPHGRPAPTHLPEVSPNLWERIRATHDRNPGMRTWRLHRALEDAGWVVEANPAVICFGLSPLGWTPPLGLRIAGRTYPLLAHPERDDLWRSDGRVAALAGAGAGAVAVVIDSGELDDVVTSIRKLHLSGASRGSGVLLLEAPRFAPLLLSAGDAAVAPRSVSQQHLEHELPAGPYQQS